MDDNVFGVTPEEEAAPPEPAPPQEDQPQGSSEAEQGAHTAQVAGSSPAPATTVEPDEEVDVFTAGPGEDGVRLGNKVWKDWQAADHVFRTFAGRAAAEAKRRRELEAKVAALEQERFTRPTPQPEQVAAPEAAPERKRLDELIDEDEIERTIATEGPAKAFKKLAALVEARANQLVQEGTEDLRPVAVRNKALEIATQVFESASSMTDAEGNRLYPELDPSSPESDVVVAFWRQNLQDPEVQPIAFTPAGVRLAVMQARAHLAANRQPASPAQAPARRAAATLQSMGSGGRTHPTATPGPTRTLPAEDAARQLIASRTHPIFGVTMER